MNEMLNQIEMEKRIQQSFNAVKLDITAFKQQLSQLQNNLQNNREEKRIQQKELLDKYLKKELEKELVVSLHTIEQRINERINAELKQQNALLQEILDRVKRSETETQESELRTVKKQLLRLEKQQNVLLAESVDFTELERHFMTEKEIISLLNEKYVDQITKQHQQINTKFAVLRHEFDELLKNNVQQKKNAEKYVKEQLNGVVTTIKKRLESVERNVTAQVRQNDIAVAIERLMDELAVLKQKSMSREEVEHLFENFSKKINSIREELDDFERNLDTVSMQTRDFRV